MTEQREPDPVEPAVANEGEATTPPAESPPVPPAERSRFSQWLASFGLGEFQNPLLTRTRPPVPRSRGTS